MRARLLIAIFASFLFLGVTCEDGSGVTEEPLKGKITNENGENIFQAKIQFQKPFPFLGGTYTYSDSEGQYIMQNGFSYPCSTDIGACNKTTSYSEWEDFVLIVTHVDYDTTIVGIVKNNNNNLKMVMQNRNIEIDTIFSSEQYNFGEFGEEHFIPTIILKSKK